jgi:hypothetical protein
MTLVSSPPEYARTIFLIFFSATSYLDHRLQSQVRSRTPGGRSPAAGVPAGPSDQQVPDSLDRRALRLALDDGDEDGIFARERPDDFRYRRAVNLDRSHFATTSASPAASRLKSPCPPAPFGLCGNV